MKYYSYKLRILNLRDLRPQNKILDQGAEKDQIWSPNQKILGYKTRT